MKALMKEGVMNESYVAELEKQYKGHSLRRKLEDSRKEE